MNRPADFYSIKTALTIWFANILLLGLVRFFELRTQESSSHLIMKSLIVFIVFNSLLFFITLKNETHYALTFLTASVNLQLMVISYFVILQMISQF